MNNLSLHEEIKRVYNNLVTIQYEIDGGDIYIHSIISIMKRQGNATEALKEFLEEFKGYDIYIFSSSELGTDKSILDKWYETFGFIKCNKKNLLYNVTHVKNKCNYKK